LKSFYHQVYEIVACIPEGKVATYGQIAQYIGRPRAARIVGWAVKNAPSHLHLPCHRVVNRNGELAPEHVFGGVQIQRKILEAEGITFDEKGCIHMDKHLWQGMHYKNI